MVALLDTNQTVPYWTLIFMTLISLMVTSLQSLPNAIAVYTQCDVVRDEYLLIEYFVDIQKENSAISLDVQNAE